MIDDLEGRVARRNAFLRAVFAGVLVAAAHAGGLAWLFTHNLSTEPPASVLGVPLEIDLADAPPEPPHDVGAPAPAAPPPPTATPDATPTPEEAPSPEPAASPEATPTQEPPPPSPEPSPEPPTPTPPPDAVVEPAPPPPPPPPPKPKPEPPKPKPRPTPSPTQKIDTEKIERERAAAEQKAQERAEARRQARAAARQANEARPSSNETRQGASARPVSSGGDLANWKGRVLARISEFPPDVSGASGTQAMVAVTIDSGGRVLSASLARGSGNSELDAAAISMVRRASPLPAPPAELGSRVTMSLPVRIR